MALAVRLAGAGWGLPQVYEEATPLRVAWKLWAWGEPHGFNGDPHTLGYPSLLFYVHFFGQWLLFAALKLTGAIHSTLDFRALYALDKTSFVLVGRGISALFGAGLVPATFALARRLAGTAAAWSSAILVAFTPALLLRATEIEVDLPLAFFVTLGCVGALRLLERLTMRRAAAAGALAGLAAASKYPGLVMIVPCLAAAILAPPTSLESPTPAAAVPVSPTRRRTGRAGGAAPGGFAARPTAFRRLGAALVVLASAALVFAATSPYVVLDHAALVRDMANQTEHMARGHFGVEGGPAFGYNARALAERLLGWPLSLLALAGVGVLALWKRHRDALVVASLPVAYLGVIGTWTMKADRYLLLVVPVAIALAAAFVAWVLARMPRAVQGARASAAWCLVVAGCGIPFALQLGRGELLERFRPDTRTEALRWVQRHAPEGAWIAAEQLGPEFANFTSPDLMEDVAPHLGQIGRRPPFYAVQFVPMFQVAAERSAPFYDLGLYRAADLFVVTGAVRSRYQMDPDRYRRQCAFYDTLERRWSRAAYFPSAGHAGPEIWIYRNPDHAGWFPSRPDVPGPVSVRDAESGMENFYYWNLGVNYETGGRVDRAIESYRMALRYPPRPTDYPLYESIATRLAYCLLSSRSPGATIVYLEAAQREATLEVESAVLRWVTGQLESDSSQFASLAIPRLSK